MPSPLPINTGEAESRLGPEAGADERPLCGCGLVPEFSLLRVQVLTVRGGHQGDGQAASGTSAPIL